MFTIQSLYDYRKSSSSSLSFGSKDTGYSSGAHLFSTIENKSVASFLYIRSFVIT